jgi:hypothetical protein
MPFPFFLAMIAFVWLMVNTDEIRKRIACCVLAALCFAFTNYSYFYTWTTGAAWLGCIVLLWAIARPEGFWKDFKAFLALGAACLFSLIPYAIMLSQRSHTMDDVQLLVLTHAPDFYRVPIYISFVVLMIIAAGIVLKKINLKERETLFAISFAVVPIVVFNQQIITGRSLQPIHYQVFIGNYVAALALVVSIGILLKKCEAFNKTATNAAIVFVTLLAVVWGFVECHYTVRVLDGANVERDKHFEVGQYLTDVYRQNGDTYKTVIMPFDLLTGDDLPTIAPQSVLWARHQHVFAGVTWQENKERYYQYLHFHNVSPEDLAEGMKTRGDFVSMIALFGWGRHTDRLNSAYKPLTRGEIDAEAQVYGEYIKDFDPRKSPETLLSYIVAPRGGQIDFTNIDRWYERELTADFKFHTLYRVRLKD